MPVFAPDDFGFSYEINGNVFRISHLDVADDFEGKHIGSAILETLVRVAYYERCEVVEISMGGGEGAEAFLRANDFHIIKIRTYDDAPGGYGIDAVRRIP